MELFGISEYVKKYSLELAFCLGIFPIHWGIYSCGSGVDRGFIRRIKSFLWRFSSLDGMGAQLRGLL